MLDSAFPRDGIISSSRHAGGALQSPVSGIQYHTRSHPGLTTGLPADRPNHRNRPNSWIVRSSRTMTNTVKSIFEIVDGGDLRGIYIFNVESVEEARRLTETDPAIQSGRLVMELHPWYGSAGLIQVNEVHKVLSKKSF